MLPEDVVSSPVFMVGASEVSNSPDQEYYK